MSVADWFSSFPLLLNIVFFGLFSTIIWKVGSKLTLIADQISDQYRISRTTVGLLFLALATSLPELATTLTAAVQSYQFMVLNNLFGGIVLQTAILAIADGFTKGVLSSYPRKADHAREAVLLIGLLSVVLIATLLEETVVIWHIGIGSVIVMFAYVGVIWLLRTLAGTKNWVPVDLPDTKGKEIKKRTSSTDLSSKEQLAKRAGFYCLVILIVGIALVICAATIAAQSGLGESFVGVTLLAAATSLPELTTTITAVRMGAYTLAISNIFGSNLIMLALILPADILYLKGPILRFNDVSVQLAIVAGIVVTTVYITGLLIRKKPRIWNFGIDSVIVIAIYALSVLFFYISR